MNRECTAPAARPEQRKQLRETFYAAWGQLLLLMQGELAELPEVEGIQRLESMKHQVYQFFDSTRTR